MLVKRSLLVVAVAVVVGLLGGFVSPAPIGGDSAFIRAASAQTAGQVPGEVLGGKSRSEMWGQVRQGAQGSVTIPDKKAGVLIQSEGENWRNIRNGPVSVIGGWALFGTIAVIALFFALRGRIRIDAGPSGRRIERFNLLERFGHWLTAVSFIVLALSGLNMLYGRYVLKPVIGAQLFADLSQLAKYLHNYVAFAFMAGLALIFVLWVRHNIPNRHDLVWLAKGGGLFRKGVHPPSRKFNAGQKLIFWAVIVGGLSLSLSGIALLFPFEFHMFGNTFAVLNIVGVGLPTDLTAMQEMQLSQLWHGIAGLLLIAVIIAHIYIGSIGMEGAFDAMGTGMVDLNWAREHHDLWVAELEGKPAAGHD
jgi:formate dehydrogenase subunit gamma